MRGLLIRSVVSVAALLAPVAAYAETPPAPPVEAAKPAPPPPPTPEEIAAAKARAEAVLARTGYGDVFEAYEDGKLPSVRHKASGMTCTVDESPDGGLHIFPGLPRGDDVSCGSTLLGITITMYATRYPQRPTATDIVRASMVAIQQNYKSVKDYTGTAVNLQTDTDPPMPQVTILRLTAKLQGREVYTRSAAAVVGDWVIAQRVTGPLKDAITADLFAGIKLNSQLMALSGAKPVPKPAAAPEAPATQ